MPSIPIDEAELVVRMLEAATGVKRPKGKTHKEAIDTVTPVIREQILRMSRAAMLYFVEQVECSSRGTVH
ncbi:hypothetical protein ACFPFP_17495 [Bradyrhizobium sp. GCM10023182]|uniref:Uncharacterized protein n=1 Tax=Bradyrhizobium zhengyangense TaxID=2911009 RepID=A0ABS9LP81_9BRAD|nr:hypothetical protein [Bradyrhizobium zhengyangense]MCG2668748.1 hypothetical protein [Bradyrhizobium zhengyangense]